MPTHTAVHPHAAFVHSLSYAALHAAGVLSLHHMLVHLGHAALLNLAVHAYRPAGRNLREGVSGCGKNRRRGKHCLPGKFRHWDLFRVMPQMPS
jgi:hypothetical protein